MSRVYFARGKKLLKFLTNPHLLITECFGPIREKSPAFLREMLLSDHCEIPKFSLLEEMDVQSAISNLSERHDYLHFMLLKNLGAFNLHFSSAA